MKAHAKIIRRIALGASLVLLLAIPLVPFVFDWLDPVKKAPSGGGWSGAYFMFIHLLSVLGQGMAIMMWMTGLAAASALASLAALAAACWGGERLLIRWLSAVPALLVLGVVALVVLVASL